MKSTEVGRTNPGVHYSAVCTLISPVFSRTDRRVGTRLTALWPRSRCDIVVVTRSVEVIVVVGGEALSRVGAEIILGRREALEALVIAELLEVAQTDGEALADVVEGVGIDGGASPATGVELLRVFARDRIALHVENLRSALRVGHGEKHHVGIAVTLVGLFVALVEGDFEGPVRLHCLDILFEELKTDLAELRADRLPFQLVGLRKLLRIEQTDKRIARRSVIVRALLEDLGKLTRNFGVSKREPFFEGAAVVVAAIVMSFRFDVIDIGRGNRLLT